MSSRKNGVDARAKKAAQLFVACEGNPDPSGRLSIPDVMRLRGYSHDEAINRTLQMQVRREVEKLRGNASTSAPAVLFAANAMIDHIGLCNCHKDCSRIDLAGGK